MYSDVAGSFIEFFFRELAVSRPRVEPGTSRIPGRNANEDYSFRCKHARFTEIRNFNMIEVNSFLHREYGRLNGPLQKFDARIIVKTHLWCLIIVLADGKQYETNAYNEISFPRKTVTLIAWSDSYFLCDRAAPEVKSVSKYSCLQSRKWNRRHIRENILDNGQGLGNALCHYTKAFSQTFRTTTLLWHHSFCPSILYGIKMCSEVAEKALLVAVFSFSLWPSLATSYFLKFTTS
jgi:hypothetical protein